MKTKNLYSEMAGQKILLVLPVIFLLFLAVYSCNESSTPEAKNVIEQPAAIPAITTPPAPESMSPDEEGIYVIVDEMPLFPGGDIAMMQFINSNIVYPEIAKVNGIQGRVFLLFCVTDKGKVSKIKILKGVDPALDAEAMRVVGLLPDWKPGKLDGKEVSVWFQLPITFMLQ